jgi:TRAP-type C4-dicarboxylate transport system permease small subunit
MIENPPVPRGIYSALDRALTFLEVVAAIIGGFMMIAAMVLTSADALLRYLFNAPLSFNSYLTTYYLMVAMLVMPMAWAFRNGGYIRFLFVASLLPEAMANLLLRVGKVVGAGYFGVLAWLAGEHFLEVYGRGDVQMGAIDWPVAWSWVWIPIGLGLLSLRLLLMTFGPADELHYAEWVNEATKEEPV